MNTLCLLIFVIGALTVNNIYSESISDTEDGQTLNYRLNTDVEPIHYELDLTPYFNNTNGKEPFTFDGYTIITLKPTRANVKEITLHQEALNISEVTLTTKTRYLPIFQWSVQQINIEHTEYNSRTHKYTINLTETLAQSKTYQLYFKFSGKLRTDMKGFYRSSYKEGNETKWLASTQMEPVHARKVFPCFDEPKFKATFSISINRPRDFKTTLSNTRTIASYQLTSDTYRDHFEQTPKMSTYLVAFIVSEFDCRENEQHTFGVCSRPNAINQTVYSFGVGQKILREFDELFDYPYNTHITKMHMAAVPDFSAGAMENWGLLTYRETALLYDPNVSTSMAQQRVAAVVAHEQTHMWFGDLVTCDWWSDTFLNEGFARFFQYFGTALIEDSWGLEQQFVVEQLQAVFAVDSLESSHALSREVNSPDEIAERFGSISYNKGASIIRMFEHTLGRDTFIAALRKYLKTNALKTTVPEKLYAAFQDEVKDALNVTEVMGSFVEQPGYPVVYVNISSDRKTIELTQCRFLRHKANHPDKTRWSIPITFASDKHNANFRDTKAGNILSGETLQIQLAAPIEWILFNVQQTGYYRVNYDDVTWSAIEKLLYESPTSVHVLNRAQIVDDALNLARAYQHNYTKALQIIEYLRNETDYVPWLSAFNNFDFILARFKNEEAHIFKNFILELITKVYEHLGFYPKSKDTRLDIYNRNNVLKYACSFGHKKCIADARAEFDKVLQENSTIPVDLVPVVYCSVISEGTYIEWNYLWKKFIAENVAAEQVTILNALGCTKQTNLISTYLDRILSDNIRLQDKHAALVSTLSQQQNIDLVLDFIIINHENITKVFESEKEVPSVLSIAISRSTTSKQIEKIQKFTEENGLQSNNELKLALKNAKINLKWAENNVPIIKGYLKKSPSSATTKTISYFVLMGLAIITFFN